MKMHEARKDGRDENNRGNSSFQSGESINGSPQVVGQYLTYPRLEYQLGHSTVAMDDKSDKLSKKSSLPLSYIASKTQHNNLYYQMLFTRHLRQEENIDKRANLIELSSINNTTYISIHPPFSEKMSRKSQDAACIYTMDIHHYPLSSIIESLPIKTCQLSYKCNCIFLQEILFTVRNNLNQMLNRKSERFNGLLSTKKLKSIREKDNQTTPNYQSQNSIIQEIPITVKIT